MNEYNEKDLGGGKIKLSIKNYQYMYSNSSSFLLSMKSSINFE